MPVVVASGLLSLALALAGCGQASPSVSGAHVPAVTIVPAAQYVAWGDLPLFHVRAEPAPPADLTVTVTVASSGCAPVQSPLPVTITAGSPAATLEVPVGVVAGEQDCEVSATIAPGEGYSIGTGGSARSATVVIAPGALPSAPPAVAGDPSSARLPSRVTIDPLVLYVTAGGALRFRLSADPAPASPLNVLLLWHDPEQVLTERPSTVTIPTSGTADFSAATRGDLAGGLGDDHIAYVHVTIAKRPRYTVGIPTLGVQVRAPGSASLVSIAARPLSVHEGEPVTFTVTADPPPAFPLAVKLNWLDGDRFAESPPRTVTVPTSGTASFALATKDDLVDNYGADIVGVSIGDLSGHHIVGTPSYATIAVEDDEFTSMVSIVADSTRVSEGNSLSFTLTANPAPPSDLTVNLGWKVTQARGPAHTIAALPDTVTIPASATTATIEVATTDDPYSSGHTVVEVEILESFNARVVVPTRARVVILNDDK